MKKILILGSYGTGTSLSMNQLMKEKYGDNIVLVTPEEAKEQGLNSMDFENTPTFEIKPAPKMPEMLVNNFTSNGSRGKGQRARNKSKFKNY